MSVAGTVNGTVVAIPAKGDTGYSATATAFFQALAAAMSAQFQFMVASGLATSAVYARPAGAADSTEVFLVATKAGKLSGLYAKGSSNASGGSVTITVRKNGSDSALTCTVANGASSASDAVNTVTVAAGDTISVKCLGNSGYASGLANLGITFSFTPS